MMVTTITEALAEVSLVKKKMETKRKKILESLTRYEHAPDPYQNEGGSAEMIKREMQALMDLQNRLIRIRSVISAANQSNVVQITLDDGYSVTRSIHDWLIWKREIAKNEIDLIGEVVVRVKQEQERFARSPQVFKDTEGNTHLVKLVTHVDFPAWVKRHENQNELLQRLDGKLSLMNALITVEL